MLGPMSDVDVTIVADVGELRSGLPDVLRALGAEVAVVPLAAGDYLVGDGIAVERKTVADLHRSIATGRLWTQLLSCRRTLDRTYLLVEGPVLDRGRISRSGVRGALLEVGDRGVTIVRSTDTEDSALWLLRIAARLRRARTGASSGRRSRRAATPHVLLSTIPGIGQRTASALLDRFGSVQAIASADLSELQRVEGIGPRRAATLARLLSADT